ncbi:MAG: hypothetical protein ABH863_00310 [Candidatus Micrarchaeota archaeon]
MENFGEVVRKTTSERSNPALAQSASTFLVLGHFVPGLMAEGRKDYRQYHTLSRSRLLPQPGIINPLFEKHGASIRQALKTIMTDRRQGPVLDSIGKRMPTTPQAVRIKLSAIPKGSIDAIKGSLVDALILREIPGGQAKMIADAMAANGASFVLALAVAKNKGAHLME